MWPMYARPSLTMTNVRVVPGLCSPWGSQSRRMARVRQADQVLEVLLPGVGPERAAVEVLGDRAARQGARSLALLSRPHAVGADVEVAAVVLDHERAVVVGRAGVWWWFAIWIDRGVGTTREIRIRLRREPCSDRRDEHPGPTAS